MNTAMNLIRIPLKTPKAKFLLAAVVVAALAAHPVLVAFGTYGLTLLCGAVVGLLGGCLWPTGASAAEKDSGSIFVKPPLFNNDGTPNVDGNPWGHNLWIDDNKNDGDPGTASS